MSGLELFGTFFAGVGFYSLSETRLKLGFLLGIISCSCLIPFFLINDMYALLGLQIFFLAVNINGLKNNW